jgi:hypothetical protein
MGKAVSKQRPFLKGTKDENDNKEQQDEKDPTRGRADRGCGIYGLQEE